MYMCIVLYTYISWRVGKRALIILSAGLSVFCSFLLSDLVTEPNQTMMDILRTDSVMAE